MKTIRIHLNDTNKHDLLSSENLKEFSESIADIELITILWYDLLGFFKEIGKRGKALRLTFDVSERAINAFAYSDPLRKRMARVESVSIAFTFQVICLHCTNLLQLRIGDAIPSISFSSEFSRWASIGRTLETLVMGRTSRSDSQLHAILEDCSHLKRVDIDNVFDDSAEKDDMVLSHSESLSYWNSDLGYAKIRCTSQENLQALVSRSGSERSHNSDEDDRLQEISTG